MLREWTLWLGTPAPCHRRRPGYASESVSLHARSRRCRAAWAPHPAASRAIVRRALADLTARRRAVVLGYPVWGEAQGGTGDFGGRK